MNLGEVPPGSEFFTEANIGDLPQE